MSVHKIVISGTPGAGKTTAIAALSDKAPVLTEVRNTDTRMAKERTTVGLDFGQIDLGDGDTVHLFGTPGQLRFEFMWRIIANDAMGLVILIDNSRPDPLGDLNVYLDAYRDVLAEMTCVIGVGRLPDFPQPGIDEFVGALSARGLVVPVLAVDVRRREDVLFLVETLLIQAEARANQDQANV